MFLFVNKHTYLLKKFKQRLYLQKFAKDFMSLKYFSIF